MTIPRGQAPPSLTDALCTRCGLCCDGSLFADVRLIGRPEAMRLEIMGDEESGRESVVGLLSTPCPALDGTRCGIYEHRPQCCRTFECQLLQDTERGAVTVERAGELIAEAFERIGRVRELLASLGQPDLRLPLKERAARALAAVAPTTPATRRQRAELDAEMTALDHLIWQTFLGSGFGAASP